MLGVGHSEGSPGPGRVGAELEERELGKHCLGEQARPLARLRDTGGDT